MAKSATKKKASSARRKVQASTVRSRKDLKQTAGSSTKAASDAKMADEAKMAGSAKAVDNAKAASKKGSDKKKAEAQRVEVKVADKKATYQKAVDEKLAAKKTSTKETKAKKAIKVEDKADEPEVEAAKIAVTEPEVAKVEAAKPEVEAAKAEPETPKIILRNDKRVEHLKKEIAHTVNSLVPSKKEVKFDTSSLDQDIQAAKSVEDALREVIERQEAVEKSMAVPATKPMDAVEPIDAAEPMPEPKPEVAMSRQPMRHAGTKKPAKMTAKAQKEAAIQQAIAKAQTAPAPARKRQPRTHFGFRRVLLAMACATAAVFAIVYFVNQSTPNISLKVAAMQSGIDARYPGYVPRDFNLSDITSENGKITLNFRNPTTGEAFTIVEEKSSWDSSALLSNYVREAYGDDYTQVAEQGLTIYIDGSDACWANGGVVYKLKTTSGSLTKKQIKAIAVSL